MLGSILVTEHVETLSINLILYIIAEVFKEVLPC